MTGCLTWRSVHFNVSLEAVMHSHLSQNRNVLHIHIFDFHEKRNVQLLTHFLDTWAIMEEHRICVVVQATKTKLLGLYRSKSGFSGTLMYTNTCLDTNIDIFKFVFGQVVHVNCIFDTRCLCVFVT